MLDKANTLKELFSYLKRRKLLWLVPMIIIFLVFGFLILFIGSSPLAPLIYPIF